MNFLRPSTIIVLVAMGSCAAGAGFEIEGYDGLGTGLSAFGTSLFMYWIIKYA